MTETFNTYTNRSIAYQVFGTICLSIIIFMMIGRISRFNIPRIYVLCLVFAEVISFLMMAFLTSTGKSYNKEGDLTLTADAITICSNVISTSEIINLEIKAANYKGRFSKFPTDGGNNSMEIQTKDAIYFCRFVIKSKTQSDNLKQIINLWQTNGVTIQTLLI